MTGIASDGVTIELIRMELEGEALKDRHRIAAGFESMSAIHRRKGNDADICTFQVS